MTSVSRSMARVMRRPISQTCRTCALLSGSKARLPHSLDMPGRGLHDLGPPVVRERGEGVAAVRGIWGAAYPAALLEPAHDLGLNRDEADPSPRP